MDCDKETERGMESRTLRLLGEQGLAALRETKVIIFGVGGVGSWCAESLARSGVGHITIVDSDRVSVSNINRQLMATLDTIGEVKVTALKRHLLKVSPGAEIVAIERIYDETTASDFDLDSYDFVVDAIDSLKEKVLLISRASSSKARLFSSMGAALKIDPTRVKVAEFRNATGCPLARALRQRFKKMKSWPAKKFKVVYSDEVLPNLGPEPEGGGTFDSRKARINGSLMHITAIFGLTLAGLVIEEAIKRRESPRNSDCK